LICDTHRIAITIVAVNGTGDNLAGTVHQTVPNLFSDKKFKLNSLQSILQIEAYSRATGMPAVIKTADPGSRAFS
jgi:hypothetical protein